MSYRLTATPPRPSTESLKTIALKMDGVNKYHPEFYNFDFEHSTDDLFYIDPSDQGSGNKNIKLTWEIGNEARFTKITDRWTIDLTTSIIDLTTKTGGIIDGLARANSDYIIYAFLDEDFSFAGIGVGQKPLSAFSAISGGTATKGTTATFTITSAYRFVVGSRVVVRNTNGTYNNDYEFNWGTVSVINSDTSIDIDMDNNSEYGVNITSVTGGEILQWDKYKPYVVTTTTQTLYEPYYTVLGEIQQDTSSNVWLLYKKTDTKRLINFWVFFSALSKTEILQVGRLVPLWAKGAAFRTDMSFGSLNDIVKILDSTSARIAWWLSLRGSGVSAELPNTGFILFDRFARLYLEKANTVRLLLVITQYELPSGGMRL